MNEKVAGGTNVVPEGKKLMVPPNEKDEVTKDEPQLRWSINKQREAN